MDLDRPPNMRIGIVEDEDEFREVLGSALAREDRMIRLLRNGQEALEVLKKESFDILITDLMMPGMDGIEVLEEVKRLHPESIVIIITGYASLDTAIQAIRGGAYDYIRKPFKLEELEIAIQHASEKISLIRDNRFLLEKLRETVNELNHLQETWDKHLANILGICWTMSKDEKNSEMQWILNQINPMPPDYGLDKREGEHGRMDHLEKLVQFKKEGLIDQDEFLLLKGMLLKKLKAR